MLSLPPLLPDERRRWRNRVLLTVVAVAVLVAFARVEHTTPLLLPMVLLVAAVIALGGLVIDAFDFESPDWEVAPSIDTFARSGDPGLARNVRLIENHLRARREDEVLPRRLAVLTDARLRRLGLNRAEPAVRQTLGPTLCAVLDGTAPPLSLADIEECVHGIESLS